jgi:F-type H+-transporting ATPase subunit delta
MGNLQIANRYAEALIQEAEEHKKIQDVSGDLSMLLDVFKRSNEFRNFLKSPVIKKEKKQQVFEVTFGKTVNPLTLKFLGLLSDKEREKELPDIIEAFFRLQEEIAGIVRVHVKTAAELSEEQLARLKSKFESYLKKQVRIEMKIEPEMIGGFVARVGDTMFNGSIKHQLEMLHQQFKEVPIDI